MKISGKKEIAEDKLRKEMRSKERLARNEEEPRIYRVTLDTVDKPNLQLIMYPGENWPRRRRTELRQKSTLKPRRMQIRIWTPVLAETPRKNQPSIPLGMRH